MDGSWLESAAVHKKGLKRGRVAEISGAGHKKRPKRGRGGVGVWFGKQKGHCYMSILKIVDAYRYYYVIIHRIFYLCVIYCA